MIGRDWLWKLRAACMIVVFGLAVAAGMAPGGPVYAQQGIEQSGRAPGPIDGAVPGDTLGTSSDSELWRAVRKGVTGSVSIQDKKAGTLIQSEGETWRSLRNGPVSLYSSWAILGTIVLLGLFYALRGRIRIEHGRSEETITRFAAVERFGHWLLGVSFIVLALTGLNVLFGRYALKPVIGDAAFGFITQVGKYLHNYLAFAFMAGLAMIFVMWVKHNLPHKTDIKWALQGGGILSKKLHPPAKKFNAGQKVIFWLVILGGVSLSVSGWQLLFPFTTHFFADTFAVLNNVFGTSLPVELSVIQEQQLASLWHTVMSIFMICVILAHIYIGSVGMEGAFDAMGSGEVDLNWAKEHHSLWVDEVQAKEAAAPSSGAAQPAE